LAQSLGDHNSSLLCHRITAILNALGHAGNAELHKEILKGFLKLMDFKIQTAKQSLEQLLYYENTLTTDVERFEANITSLKQFHIKFMNNIKFMKTISRYDPMCCFLEYTQDDLEDEWARFQGVVLNISCPTHLTHMPMSSYMLFGVISRNGQIPVMPAPDADTEEKIVTKKEIDWEKLRIKRKKAFKKLHVEQDNFTKAL
jgi:hypothetical protein